MNRRHRLLLLFAVATALLLAAPGAAFGLDYCVGSPVGCSGVPEGTDLQQALNDAKATTTVADRVLIGPGTYTQMDGFSYIDGNAANTVEIRGVGSPKPTLTMTTSAVMFPTVLNVAQNGSTVTDLAIDIPPTGANSKGLVFGNGNTAQNVTVTGAEAAPNLQTGIQMGNSSVANSTVTLSQSNGSGIFASANGPIGITDTTVVSGRGIDLAVGTGNTAVLRRNRISSNSDGILMYYGDVDLDNTLFDLRGGSGDAIYMDTVNLAGELSNTIDASQLTIRNGDSSSAGIRQSGGAGNADPNAVQTLNLQDSIIRDVGHPIDQQMPAVGAVYTVNSDHNDYDQTQNLPMTPNGTDTFRNESAIFNVDPLFLAPINGSNGLAGDYRPATGSPVIDIGSATPLAAGETDLAGLPRIVDGAPPFSGAVRDLGAYEYQPVPPQGQTGTTPVPPALVPTKCKKKRKKHSAAAAKKKCKKKKKH
jgi:hypothetical protein